MNPAGPADADPARVDLLVAGLGPGGCAAALAARARALSTLAVEARGPEATRAQLVENRARLAEWGDRVTDVT